MKRFFIALPLLIILYGFLSDYPNKKEPEITSQEIQEHINFLASDELKGRFTGSDEIKKAAEYIKNEFESYGLLPFFNDSYFQNYPFIAGLELTGNNSVTLMINEKEEKLKIREDFIPASFSDTAEVTGEMVFAGYGISAPDLNYDDYKDFDVTGKIVVVMRYNPDIENPHSKFDDFSSLRYKASTAKDKGAKGIIIVNGYIPKDDEDKLVELKYDQAPAIKSFPVIHIKRKFIDDIFKAEGLNFQEYQKNINDLKLPATFLIKNSHAEFKTEVNQIVKGAMNIAGYLKGNDPVLQNEYLIIGAHYDHIGMGETGSLYRGDDPQIHNGADDNASGTTGVLELAERFAAEKDNLKRSIIFITFSGEELGLLGSDYFVKNLSIPYKQAAAMINMDMIGRMNAENSLIVYGTGTSTKWKNLLNENNEYNFKLTFNDEGFGPSDHSSFYSKEIPVLFFFTGTHTDYHRPSDDADKIEFQKEEKILKYIYKVANNLISDTSKPDYVSVPRKDTGRAMRFKVYVGTIPDYSSQVEGFKINGVSEGSPAQKGGLKGGDIIIEFGGKKVSNIYDYMYAMNSYAPGDVVDVKVKRNDEELKLQVELAAR